MRTEPNKYQIDLGISEQNRLKIAEGLSKLLADSYSVYLKTHKFHWNVTGPMFQTLHAMFETQYTELALAVDMIAERIRSLGSFAPGSYSEFSKLSTVKDALGQINAHSMIAQLVQDHETVVRTARSLFPIAETASDQVTLDLLTQRMQVHEKTCWMLRSLIEE